MQISMTLPTMLPHGRAELLAWCRSVDEGPWAGLAVPERITYTSSSWTVQLAAAAALTERVPLWTTVIVLPAHSAVQTAKDLATVDQLCGGRLRAGLGVGGREQDFQAVDAPFGRRWSRLDEQVALMQQVWSGEPPFEGSAPVGPPPVQAGGPPLYSGAFGPKALARAAQWAVGVVDGSTVTGANVADGAGHGGSRTRSVDERRADREAVRRCHALVRTRRRCARAAARLRVHVSGNLRPADGRRDGRCGIRVEP